MLEFSLRIYDSDSYDTIDETGLLQLTTSAAEGFTQPVDDSGEVVYDADGLRVICKGLKDDSIWDGCVVFLFENESGDTLTLSGENVSVNGFMVDPGLWTRLRTGTRAVDAMYLLDLDELGLESIDEVENIEFSLNIITDDFDIRSTEITKKRAPYDNCHTAPALPRQRRGGGQAAAACIYSSFRARYRSRPICCSSCT